MGQITMGILLGEEPPRDVELRDDDRPPKDGGLLDRWQLHCRPQVEALMASEGINAWRAEDRFVPDWTDDGLIGFWVAVGASGKDGVPDLGTVALDDIATTEPYAAAYLIAQNRWHAFAAWCRTQGVVLPTERLWIAETEVA